MPLDDVVQDFLDDPEASEDSKNNIRSLMASHLVSGMKLQQAGLLREAIDEFAKESSRPINSDIDKEIAQKSYWHIGVAYRKLGETESAKVAFQSARELFTKYRVGKPPHHELAEMLLEEGLFEEAISVCQELLDSNPHSGIKHLLAKAQALKRSRSE